MREVRKVYKVFGGQVRKKETTRKTEAESAIKMDLEETGWVEWIQLAQDRDRWRALVNAVMNLRVLAPSS
jgi:hypothetical protein